MQENYVVSVVIKFLMLIFTIIIPILWLVVDVLVLTVSAHFNCNILILKSNWFYVILQFLQADRGTNAQRDHWMNGLMYRLGIYRVYHAICNLLFRHISAPRRVKKETKEAQDCPESLFLRKYECFCAKLPLSGRPCSKVVTQNGKIADQTFTMIRYAMRCNLRTFWKQSYIQPSNGMCGSRGQI